MKKWNFEQKHMDTRVAITIYSSRKKGDVAIDIQKAFSVFQKLEAQFSIFRLDSELTRVNQKAGTPTPVGPLLFQTLKYAIQVSKDSQGAFTAFRPFKNMFTNCTNIRLDPSANMVTIPSKTTLDLNSIVKGLAIDMALDCFGDNENIMIEAGGDIKVKGFPPKAYSWDIGIRNPAFPQKIITVVHIRDCAICTSGEYFRTHLVNPLSKKFKSNNTSVSSVTVIAPTAREADALSTAAYFMDINQAVSFVEKHDSTSCLIIDSANNVYASPRMKPLFKT